MILYLLILSKFQSQFFVMFCRFRHIKIRCYHRADQLVIMLCDHLKIQFPNVFKYKVKIVIMYDLGLLYSSLCASRRTTIAISIKIQIMYCMNFLFDLTILGRNNFIFYSLKKYYDTSNVLCTYKFLFYLMCCVCISRYNKFRWE